MRNLDEAPTSPYIGPSPFETKHQSIFFGRDVEADTLFSLLIAERVVLFYAQSGAGKSSLVNAKIIPKLQAEGYLVLPKARVGLEPGAMKPRVENPFVYSALSSLSPSEINAENYANANLPLYREWIPNADQDKRRWLIFDQFEELLTMNQERWVDRKGFMDQVALALEYDRLLSVVFVIRSDYVAGVDLYADTMPNKLRTRFYMELLKRPAALQAIQLPAKEFGCTFADDAADELVKKVCLVNTPDGEKPGEYVESVLLQVACRELWNKVKDKTSITNEDVKGFAVEDALKTFYESAIRAKPIADLIAEETLRRWFADKLIIPPGIRGQVIRDDQESGGIKTEIADALVNAHLLRSESSRGALWYELAHDRLVKPIIASNNSNETQYERLARLWDAADRPDDLLLKSIDLTQAEAWAAKHPKDLGDRVERFFSKSREYDNQRRSDADRLLLAEANRRFKKFRVVVLFLLVAAVVIAVGYGLALFKARRALAASNSDAVAAKKAADDANEAKARATGILIQTNKRLKLINAIYPSQLQGDDFFIQAEAADQKLREIAAAHGLSANPITVGLPLKVNEQKPLAIILNGEPHGVTVITEDTGSKLPSDSVFYVSDAPAPGGDDWKYQYVAYLMLRAGLPVKVIMRTVSSDAIKNTQQQTNPSETIGLKDPDWHSSIVVGTSKSLALLNCSLTVEQVASHEWKTCTDSADKSAPVNTKPLKQQRRHL
jgi:hypothetical protein